MPSRQAKWAVLPSLLVTDAWVYWNWALRGVRWMPLFSPCPSHGICKTSTDPSRFQKEGKKLSKVDSYKQEPTGQLRWAPWRGVYPPRSNVFHRLLQWGTREGWVCSWSHAQLPGRRQVQGRPHYPCIKVNCSWEGTLSNDSAVSEGLCAEEQSAFFPSLVTVHCFSQ